MSDKCLGWFAVQLQSKISVLLLRLEEFFLICIALRELHL